MGFKLRQKKVTVKAVAKADVVDLDSYKPKEQPKRRHWVEGFANIDKSILRNGSVVIRFSVKVHS